jgi:hypothetical protein
VILSGAKDTENATSIEQHLAALDQENVEVRSTASAFTTSYVGSNALDVSNCKCFLVRVNLNGTGITGSQMKVQFSDSLGSVWYDLTHLDIVATANPNVIITEIEMGGSNTQFMLPFVNPGAALMRLAVKANAAAGGVQLVVSRGQGSGSWPLVNGS